MKMKALIFISILTFVFNFSAFAARYDSEDFVRTYPDGGMGIDLGGGYEVAPIGPGGKEQMILPEGFRDSYVNTRYGPMTQQGFSFYPDFKFSDTQRREDKEEKQIEQGKEERDYIFQVTGESTTGAPEMSPIWGVYIPPKEQDH